MPALFGDSNKDAAMATLFPKKFAQGGMTLNAAPPGLAPYGFRHEESVFAPPAAKGKGYFGLLPHAEGDVSTEISAHDDMARGFPLLVPGLDAQQVGTLLEGESPTQQIYNAAMAWAEARRKAGLSPFAQPNELRLPSPR